MMILPHVETGMERARPRRIRNKNAAPLDRQRRWRKQMEQDPDRVVYNFQELIEKIYKCLDTLMTTTNKERYDATRTTMRHLYKVFRDIVNAGVFDTSEMTELIHTLDSMFSK